MNAFFSRLGVPALCFLLLLLCAAGQPVTVKELCLMLRGGYTADEVLRETAGRPLLEPIDAEAEKSLRAAGADARLVASLRATHPTFASNQASAVPQRQGASAPRSLPAPVANGNAPSAPAPAADPTDPFGKMAGLLRGQLVAYRNGVWQRYDEPTLANKQLFAIYFAARANPQCQTFTPQLEKFYRDFVPKHPNFEVVFFSEDPSSAEMQDYVRESAMPWPAYIYENASKQTDLVALGKQGLPRLVLIDGACRLVADSFVGGQYVGPQHVLDEITRLANATGGPPSAQAGPGDPAATQRAEHWGQPAARPSDSHYVESLLRGKLVALHDGSIVPQSNSALDGKKLYGLYFSCYMSRAGHEFTPDLIQFYQRMHAVHPEFEIVLVSGDPSPFAMENMMQREQMPWPAVAYDQIPQIKMMERFLEHSMASRLMIADGTGWVMADYRINGANNNLPLIMTDLEKVLANPTVLSSLSPPQTAAGGAGGLIGVPDSVR